MRWLPIGTHDWNKFLTPEELENIAKKNNFSINEQVGVKFNLLTKLWKISEDTSVNYIITFIKN